VSEDVAAAGDLHHLGNPVAGGVGWLEPLGYEHRSRRRVGHASADGCDLRLHLGDDGAASCRDAEQFGEREDALFDLGKRVRVERDDLGVGCAQLADAVGGDGADAQRFWVRISSGWSASSNSRSIAYNGRPSPTASRTALSISRLVKRVVSTREAVTTGRPRTSGGQSHSSEMPTSDSTRPSSATISVALGRSEQIRILRLLHAAVRSQKTNPSRSTISPVSQAIGSAKIGPAETKVWNSPFSPQGSTPGGS
jgi:hypothetical protein